MNYAPGVRYIYGYIGLIERLRGHSQSHNATTGFLCHCITKLAWTNDNGQPKFCYARVLAYTANFSCQDRSSENLVSIRDLAQGLVCAPHTRSHTGTNLQFWRFADIQEWPGFSPPFFLFLSRSYFPFPRGRKRSGMSLLGGQTMFHVCVYVDTKRSGGKMTFFKLIPKRSISFLNS